MDAGDVHVAGQALPTYTVSVWVDWYQNKRRRSQIFLWEGQASSESAAKDLARAAAIEAGHKVVKVLVAGRLA